MQHLTKPGCNPLSPPAAPVQGRLQGPPAKSKFLAVSNDQLPWPTDADGAGFSLVLANPGSAPDHGLDTSWIAHAVVGGSPGEAD